MVCVRVKRLTLGDLSFSSSLPGSAWTVTLMRHGLEAPRGVLRTMDLEGDSDMRLCTLGEAWVSGSRGVRVALRLDAAVLLLSWSLVDMESGSGEES